jgi:hypothetical protein
MFHITFLFQASNLDEMCLTAVRHTLSTSEKGVLNQKIKRQLLRLEHIVSSSVQQFPYIDIVGDCPTLLPPACVKRFIQHPHELRGRIDLRGLTHCMLAAASEQRDTPSWQLTTLFVSTLSFLSLIQVRLTSPIVAKPRPDFLTSLDAGAKLTYSCIAAVDLLEKLVSRDYPLAIAILQILLGADMPYARHKRGKWYERLCIDLDHLASGLGRDRKRQKSDRRTSERRTLQEKEELNGGVQLIALRAELSGGGKLASFRCSRDFLMRLSLIYSEIALRDPTVRVSISSRVVSCRVVRDIFSLNE